MFGGIPGRSYDEIGPLTARVTMRRQRASVTNPDYYILMVVVVILAACVGALMVGFAAGSSL
jgi:hypothetical protein